MPTPTMRARLPIELAAQINEFAATASFFQHGIAAALGPNQGRASEVLSGKPFASVSPTR